MSLSLGFSWGKAALLDVRGGDTQTIQTLVAAGYNAAGSSPFVCEGVCTV